MMTAFPYLPLAILAVYGVAAHARSPAMHWSQLPPIPDAEGFAAPFAGVSDGALLVAGGANIPENKWGDVFVKQWYDSVFALERPDGTWKHAGKLPHPLGYGVSVTWGARLVCIGGSDLAKHYREVFALHWKAGALTKSDLSPLPKPCANACGALIGSTIYVAGGIETPTATSALKAFWALDLARPESGWRELDPCPGPARMLAVAGARDGSFFLFSGTALTAGSDGKPVRQYLRDAWRFAPGTGWKQLPDLPRAAVAAPSPAAVFGEDTLVFTGDDGANVTFQPVDKHPGFPRDVLSYDVRADRWSVVGTAPFSCATAPTVVWEKQLVILNGEVRPRLRTPEVWALDLP
jgi:N-acetylneuraminic acid mutarotase